MYILDKIFTEKIKLIIIFSLLSPQKNSHTTLHPNNPLPDKQLHPTSLKPNHSYPHDIHLSVHTAPNYSFQNLRPNSTPLIRLKLKRRFKNEC